MFRPMHFCATGSLWVPPQVRTCGLCPTQGTTAGSCPRTTASLLPSCSALAWAERLVCMFAFLLLRETGHLDLCFSQHLQHVLSCGVTGYLCHEPAACCCSRELLSDPWEKFPGPLTTERYVWNGTGRSSPLPPCLFAQEACAGASPLACSSHPLQLATLAQRLPAAPIPGALPQSSQVYASLLFWCLCWQRKLGLLFDATEGMHVLWMPLQTFFG